MPPLKPDDPAVTDVVLMAASVLLDYPGPASSRDLALVAAALAELPSISAHGHLEQFLTWWRTFNQSEREQFYVAGFDMGGVSLHLTERRPGTAQQRGAALLALRQSYRKSGAWVIGTELPDYLPLILEAAAHVNSCFSLLVGERVAIEGLWAALTARGNPFAHVVAAVLEVLPWMAATPTLHDDAGGRRAEL